MITSFMIKNYKNYQSLLVPLTRVTLLGGRNNVGKTNFLEALFMVQDKFDPQMILRHLGFRGLNELALEPEVMWGPIFRNYSMEKEICLSVVKNNKKEVMKITYNPNYIRTSIPVQHSTLGNTPQIRTDQKATPSYALDVTYKADGEKEQRWHLFFDVEGMGVHVESGKLGTPRAVIIASRNRINPNEDVIRFGELDILGQQDSVLEFLRILEPRLKSVSSISTGRESLIYGDIGLGRKIPISFMGDGLSRLMSIVLAILTSKGGTVLIDEIENGIHYSVMGKVWEGIAKAAKESDVQIVATTHSYECLQAAIRGLDGELESEFSYVRLERKDDEVLGKHFDYKKLSTALENEWEVR